VQGGRRASVSTARRLRPAADPRQRHGRAGSAPRSPSIDLSLGPEAVEAPRGCAWAGPV